MRAAHSENFYRVNFFILFFLLHDLSETYIHYLREIYYVGKIERWDNNGISIEMF